MMVGKTGKFSPTEARLLCAAVSLTDALTWGSRSLSSCHRWPRAFKVLSLLSSTPRLLRRARSSASLNESERTPGVALPSGTLPENGLCWLIDVVGVLADCVPADAESGYPMFCA